MRHKRLFLFGLFVCLFFTHLLPLILGSGAKCCILTRIRWWIITQWSPKKPPKSSWESRDPGQLLKFKSSLCSEMEVRDVCGFLIDGNMKKELRKIIRSHFLSFPRKSINITNSSAVWILQSSHSSTVQYCKLWLKAEDWSQNR